MTKLSDIGENRRVLLVSDNRYSLNWGCRATSLSLIYVLEKAGYSVVSLSEKLSEHDSRTKMLRIPTVGWLGKQSFRIRVNQLIEKILPKVLGGSFSSSSVDIRSLDISLAVSRLKRLAKGNSIAQQIIQAVKDADVVVVNGEGSPIFTDPPRVDLLFHMIILKLAKEFGKQCCYVNSIVSPCPINGIHAETVSSFIDTTKNISLFAVRDYESLKIAEELGLSPCELAVYPDALFSIRPHLLGRYGSFTQPISSSDFVGHPEARISQSYKLLPRNYICVSGASVPPGVSRDRWQQWFVDLVKRLQLEFALPIVLIQPCLGDSFLSGVSDECDAYFVPVSTSIYWGSRILANSAVYISGRYHPGIMASFGGVPQIMLESNSHKTFSLQQLLGELAPDVYPIASSKETIDAIVEATRISIGTANEKRERRLATVGNLVEESLRLGDKIASEGLSPNGDSSIQNKLFLASSASKK